VTEYAERWLKIFDSNDFDAAWREGRFRADRADYVRTMLMLRDELGQATGRQLLSMNQASGALVNVKFRTQYERMPTPVTEVLLIHVKGDDPLRVVTHVLGALKGIKPR